jgi:transcription elongation factor SPT6
VYKAHGIKPHEIVQNFNAQSNVKFVDDPELNPIAYAEQFVDPDPTKAQTPETLLERARMILATELGRDPLLKSHVRQLFKEEATISCEPTDKGIVVIDEEHPYFVSIMIGLLLTES